MSKFIPHTRKSPQPRWVYLANPSTGGVTKEKRTNFMEIYALQESGYRVTSREVYERFFKGTGTKRSFTPTQYPTGSGRYVPSNIYLSIQ